jgi:hypothetical protein
MTTFNSNTSNLFKASQNENEALTYTVNWAGDLDTDTINSDTWTSESGGLTIANESNTDTESICRISAGNPGCYRVVNQIVTAGGDTLERILEIEVGENNPDSLLDYV